MHIIDLPKEIDQAHSVYKECWIVLCSMKEKQPVGILQFQEKLFTCLYSLEEAYRRLCENERETIENKSVIACSDFTSSMKDIHSQKASINRIIATGKVIGDAFAWFFYQNDQEKLWGHLGKPAIKHLPTGIGGFGESEMVKRIKGFDGCLMIYHGTTNILRVGDVSLIDLKSFKIIGVGDIKTKQTGNKTYESTVHFIGNERLIRASRSFPKRGVKSADDINTFAEQRLQRQKKEMLKLLEGSEQKIQAALTMPRLIDHQEKIQQLFANYSSGTSAVCQAGPGLLISLYKNQGTFSELMMTESSATGTLLCTNEDLNGAVNGIIPKDFITPKSEISMKLGLVLYSKIDEAHVLPGTRPLFWSNIETEALESLYFHRFSVVTSFLDSHFIKKLRDRSFNVQVSGKDGTVKISKKIREKNVTLQGSYYYISLIMHHLYDEDVVIEMIDLSFKEIENIPENVHQVQFRHASPMAFK